MVVHGCFGHWAAVNLLFGQLYSTVRTVSAVKVTPFLNRMLPMTGVSGR